MFGFISRFFDYNQFGPWNGWSVYWLVVWFAFGFGAPEFYALETNPHNTLSDQVWRIEALGGWVGFIAHLLMAIGFGWLWFHMVLRLFR